MTYGTYVGLPVSSQQWQIPVGLQLVPPTVLATGLVFFPESVRWLAKKGRTEEAFDALTWLRADDGTLQRPQQVNLLTKAWVGPEVRAEFEEIKTGIALELQVTEGFRKKELLEPANRYRLIIAFGLFLGQQCTGMTGT